MAIEALDQPTAVQRLESLSDDSLRSIASLIIGEFDGAPRVRGTYGISQLFTRCGIQAAYDGSSKHSWTFNLLKAANPGSLARVITRLSTVDEYRDNTAALQSAVLFLNRVLITNSVQVVVGQGTAFLTEVDPDVPIPELSAKMVGDSALIAPDFEQLDLSDGEAQELISQWEEATKCYYANAFLAAMVMFGSLLESVLLLGLKRNREAITTANLHFTDANNRDRPPERWSLSEMIEATSRLGWTTQKVRAFSHSLREYRNLIHAELRRRPEELPRAHECLIASIIVTSVVNELRMRINSPTSTHQ